ncbi:hypothetical protein GF407_19180 [candidate division KSB1 bacterium]|nr:hypothetical protein [candidate division KSB1 bacterium]
MTLNVKKNFSIKNIFSGRLLMKHRPVLAHIAFWSIAFIFFVYFFGHHQQAYWQTAIFVAWLMPPTMAAAYLLLYFLLPRYIFNREKRSIPLFLLFTFYTLIAFVWLTALIIYQFLLYQILSISVTPMDYTTIDILVVVIGLLFIILVATSIRILLYWASEQNKAQKLLQEKIKAELRMLRTQLNPHFLFNTLNSIYALALNKSDQAPAAVLKLSDMLDYILYDCKSERLPLSKEIRFLGNYIELQKLRYGNRLEVKFDSPQTSNVMVPPMILLPFVENAFKHGARKKRGRISIDIVIILEEKHAKFYMQNNFASPENKKNAEGIGQESVIRQLDLLFDKNYQLDISQTKELYTITLTFPVKKDEENDDSLHDCR